MNGFSDNPMLQIGMGLLGGNYGRNSREAFANAMRGGLLGMQQAGVSQARQAQTQAVQQRLLMQQAAAKREKEEREAWESYVATLPPQDQAMARGNPELYKTMMTQKWQQQYAPPIKATDAPSNIREWRAFQQMPPDQQQQYLAMKRANPFMDTGPTLVQRSQVDPTQTLATVQKGLKPGEQPAVREQQAERSAVGQVRGREQAQAAVDLPGAALEMEDIRVKLDELKAHPGKSWEMGASGYLPDWRGSERSDFVNRREQVLGGTFTQAYQTLKGGGSITEVETGQAKVAMNRMEKATSEKAFDAAAEDYWKAVQRGYRKLQVKAGNIGSAKSSGGWSIKKAN